jgi:hypothetical protein
LWFRGDRGELCGVVCGPGGKKCVAVCSSEKSEKSGGLWPKPSNKVKSKFNTNRSQSVEDFQIPSLSSLFSLEYFFHQHKCWDEKQPHRKQPHERTAPTRNSPTRRNKIYHPRPHHISSHKCYFSDLLLYFTVLFYPFFLILTLTFNNINIQTFTR